MKDTHVLEIPADGDRPPKPQDYFPYCFSSPDQHPLQEIAQSPGHLLLLKLWQRNEHYFCRRIAHKESLIDSLRRQVFHLCSLFFTFHAFFLTLLFTSSIGHSREGSCRSWWLPCCLSVVTSLVMICWVQYKMLRCSKMTSKLESDRGDSRGLSRCIQELRMKGSSFDLSKEPLVITGSGGGGGVKKMKSSSVKINYKINPLKWCYENVVSICLVCVTGLVFPASKFMLCS